MSLYGMQRNSRPSHSDTIFLSVCASENSLDACAPTFSSCSSMSMAPHSSSVDALGGFSGSYGPLPSKHVSKILTQWRGRRAGLATSLSSGMNFRNSSISSRVRITT